MTSERLGQTVHIPSAGGGSALCSARFLVRAFGGDAEHNTAGIGTDDNQPIVWDSTPEFDDIGFDPEYGTNGKLWPPDASDYLITASAEIAADGAFTTGTMMLSIETAVSTVNTQATTQAAPFNTNPEISISTVHRFPGGMAEYFRVHIHTFGFDDSSTVAKAALTITNLGGCGVGEPGG